MALNVWIRTTSPSNWWYTTNWSLGYVPPNNSDDLLWNATSVLDSLCDISRAVGSITIAAAYTGELLLTLNKTLGAVTWDVFGKLTLDTLTNLNVLGGGKLYLEAGSLLTCGTGADLNMQAESQVELLAGTISGDAGIVFYGNSAARPLLAQDYSVFARAAVVANAFVLGAGTHTYGLISFQTWHLGESMTFYASTNNPLIIFKEDVSMSLFAGSEMELRFGQGGTTFKKSVDLALAKVSASINNVYLFDGTTLQNISLPVGNMGGIAKFQNTGSGCSIAITKTAYFYGVEINGKLAVEGKLSCPVIFDMLSNAVLSGAGDIYIYAAAVTTLNGSSSFTGVLHVTGQSEEDYPAIPRLAALDYSAKFPVIKFENDSPEFESTSMLGAGNYTFGELRLINTVDCAVPTRYDWATNNPNVTVNDDFIAEVLGGSIVPSIGTGKLLLKKNVILSLVDAAVSAGETELGGTSGTHDIVFGAVSPGNLTVNCGAATKNLYYGSYAIKTLKMQAGTLGIEEMLMQTVETFSGTGGTVKGIFGGPVLITLANKSTCSGVSFQKVQLQAANMINAKNGGIALSADNKGIVFQDSFGDF